MELGVKRIEASPNSVWRPVDASASDGGEAGSALKSALRDASRTAGLRKGDNMLTRALTDLLKTYKSVNPAFNYSLGQNPRRILTEPSEGVFNDGRDNANYELILRVNDELGENHPNKYQVLNLLGSGTFGQVVRCVNLRSKDKETVAIKVIKNQYSYFQQAKMEIHILKLLQKTYGNDDRLKKVKLQDYFMHANHLCLCFEELNVNLYELLKSNYFVGLSLTVINVFVKQLMGTLSTLAEAGIIHCDLKPENILLEDGSSACIKLIDFGSACFENQTTYTYIQSRYYRSPEVLCGYQYNSKIDMWSSGCILAELFLGLPLFPGSNEYNQMARIVEMCQYPPPEVLEKGEKASRYFKRVPPGTVVVDTAASPLVPAAATPVMEAPPPPVTPPPEAAAVAAPDTSVATGESTKDSKEKKGASPGRTKGKKKKKESQGSGRPSPPKSFPVIGEWQFKTEEEYCRDNNASPSVWKRYLNHSKLEDLIMRLPYKDGCDADSEQKERVKFIDLLRGLLNPDVRERWTAKQASEHPFVSGAPFISPGHFHRTVVLPENAREDARRQAEQHSMQQAMQRAVPIPHANHQTGPSVPYPASWGVNSSPGYSSSPGSNTGFHHHYQQHTRQEQPMQGSPPTHPMHIKTDMEGPHSGSLPFHASWGLMGSSPGYSSSRGSNTGFHHHYNAFKQQMQGSPPTHAMHIKPDDSMMPGGGGLYPGSWGMSGYGSSPGSNTGFHQHYQAYQQQQQMQQGSPPTHPMHIKPDDGPDGSR